LAGKTLLVLDTVTGSEGERLYAREGWQHPVSNSSASAVKIAWIREIHVK